jgi:hypothetical protein
LRRAGVSISGVAFALLLYTSLTAPAYTKAHPQLNQVIDAEYARPWPVALACAVVLAGIMLALVPLRRGERRALWTSLAMWVIRPLTRLATDPRCMVVLRSTPARLPLLHDRCGLGSHRAGIRPLAGTVGVHIQSAVVQSFAAQSRYLQGKPTSHYQRPRTGVRFC